jgi:predicted transcriptional regulator
LDAEGVLLASVESSEVLVAAIRAFLAERGVSARDFCERSGMPANTFYKILSGERKDFMLSNLRKLVHAMQVMDESGKEETIGVITARGALDTLRRVVQVQGRESQIHIREYPAMTIEEEIIQGIRAEREKMKGVICGPIAANTLEKVVRIPVVGLQFEEEALLKAVERVSKKI